MSQIAIDRQDGPFFQIRERPILHQEKRILSETELCNHWWHRFCYIQLPFHCSNTKLALNKNFLILSLLGQRTRFAVT